MKTAKKIASGTVDTREATKVAAKVPTRMPGVIARTTSQRTAPRAWWARRLDTEVSTMAAIEVPSAMCTTWDCGKPWARKKVVSIGTMMPPPPTPSRPAKKPTAAPSTG